MLPNISLKSFCFFSYISIRNTNYSLLTVPSEFSSKISSNLRIMSSSILNYISFYFIYSELSTPSLSESIILNISSEFFASGKQATNF
jgi:hypothetical protein